MISGNGFPVPISMTRRSPMQPFPELTPAARAANLREFLRTKPNCTTASGHTELLWIFAYGSLIWRTNFAPASRVPARLEGYQRACCVWTVKARGTPQRPGLGLGLRRDARAHCTGVALAIAAAEQTTVLAQLWEREMLTAVYSPTWVQLWVGDELPSVQALAFVVNEENRQYAGGLSHEEQARFIATAHGELGSCAEYLESTLVALRTAGIGDSELEQLNKRVTQLAMD